MSAMTSQALWQQLADESKVEGERPATASIATPWYVRVMLGVAGWIGACFMLGFVFAVFAALANNAVMAMVLGLAACGGAFVIFRAARDNDFAAQFGLALSLAGQALFFYGISDTLKLSTAAIGFEIALFEAVLMVVMPNFIHRLLSGWAAFAALDFALSAKGLPAIVMPLAAACTALVWLRPLSWVGAMGWVRAVGYGAVIALLQIQAWRLAELHFGSMLGDKHGWSYMSPYLGVLLLTAALIYVTVRLLEREGIALNSRPGQCAIAAALLMGGLSFLVPGLAAGSLVLLLGFAAVNRVLMGLAFLALALFLSHYYYMLQTTLLVKSMVLAASGIVLLAARTAMNMAWPVEDHHA